MIEILRPGLQTTLQDGGRPGFQAWGVPVCGAMDWQALCEANLLAGNPMDEAALEICALGPSIRFLADGVFALAGAPCGAALNGSPLEERCAFLAHKGDVLELGPCTNGLRAYLAASGGFDVAPVMGSRSTCLSAGFGGFEGRPLKTGDRLGLRAPQLWLRDLPRRRLPPTPAEDRPVRVILGPQEDAFSQTGIRAFFSSEYRFGAQCDRMGCRLEGAPVELRPGASPNIISDGVAMGSIQVPNGQPIVMMADRQTTGGYVKLGTVITADLPLMAQKRPGDRVRFEPVTVEQGQRAYADALRRLRLLGEELDRGDLW